MQALREHEATVEVRPEFSCQSRFSIIHPPTGFEKNGRYSIIRSLLMH
jgi:hypothetical protein